MESTKPRQLTEQGRLWSGGWDAVQNNKYTLPTHELFENVEAEYTNYKGQMEMWRYNEEGVSHYRNQALGPNGEAQRKGQDGWDFNGQRWFGSGFLGELKKMASNITRETPDELPEIADLGKQFAQMNVERAKEHEAGALFSFGPAFKFLEQLTKNLTDRAGNVLHQEGSEGGVAGTGVNLLNLPGRAMGEVIRLVLKGFEQPSKGFKSVWGTYSSSVREISENSPIPEQFGGGESLEDMIPGDLEKKHPWLLDAAGVVKGLQTMLPTQVMWNTFRAGLSARPIEESLGIVEDNFIASRIYFSGFIDTVARAEFIARVKAGENAGLIAKEYENPIAEAIGEFIVDPLNVVGLIGKGAARAGRVGNVADDFFKHSDELTEIGQEIRQLGNVLDEGLATDVISRLADAQHAAVGKTAEKLSDMASDTSLFAYATSGKRYFMSRRAEQVFAAIIANADSPEQATEALYAIYMMGSKNVDEVRVGVDLASQFKRSEPLMLMGEAQNELGNFLQRAIQGDPDKFLDDLNKVVRQADEAGALADEAADLLRLESGAGDIKAPITAEEALHAHLDKMTNLAVEKMFPTIAERIANGDDISRAIRQLAKFDSVVGKNIWQPANRFFAAIYMGMSPGYAIRNAITNTVHILVDEGPSAFLSGGKIMSPASHMKRAKFLLGGRRPKAIGFTPAMAAAGVNPDKKVWNIFMRWSQWFEEKAAEVVVGTAINRHMKQALRPGMAIPDITPLVASGMGEDSALLIQRLLVEHGGNVRKAEKAFRKAVATGSDDVFRSLYGGWIDAEDLEALSELGLTDEVAELLQKASDEGDAVARLDGILQRLRAEASRVADEPAGVARDGHFVEDAAEAGMVRKAGHVSDQRVAISQSRYTASDQALDDYLTAAHEMQKEASTAIMNGIADGVVDRDAIKAIEKLMDEAKPIFGDIQGVARRQRQAQWKVHWAESDRLKNMPVGADWAAEARKIGLRDISDDITKRQVVDRFWNEIAFPGIDRMAQEARDGLGASVEAFAADLTVVSGVDLQYSNSIVRARSSFKYSVAFDNAEILRDNRIYKFTINGQKFPLNSVEDIDNTRHLLAAINKYLPEGMPKFKRLNDIPNVEIARRAIQRRAAKRISAIIEKAENVTVENLVAKGFTPEAAGRVVGANSAAGFTVIEESDGILRFISEGVEGHMIQKTPNSPSIMTFTEVSPALRGQGLGPEVARARLRYLQQRGEKIFLANEMTEDGLKMWNKLERQGWIKRLDDVPTASQTNPYRQYEILEGLPKTAGQPVPQVPRLALDDVARNAAPMDVEDIGGLNNTDWYHGSGTPGLAEETVDALATYDGNLFGAGIYLTNNPNVAKSYAKIRGAPVKGVLIDPVTIQKGTGTPVLYSARVNVKKLINADDVVGTDVLDIMRRSMGKDLAEDLDLFLIKNPDASYADAYGEFAKLIGQDEGGFGDAALILGEYNLELVGKGGYDAIAYTGGVRTGGAKHQALMLLDPQDATGTGRSSITQFGELITDPNDIARARGLAQAQDQLLQVEAEIASHAAKGTGRLGQPVDIDELRDTERALQELIEKAKSEGVVASRSSDALDNVANAADSYAGISDDVVDAMRESYVAESRLAGASDDAKSIETFDNWVDRVRAHTLSELEAKQFGSKEKWATAYLDKGIEKALDDAATALNMEREDIITLLLEQSKVDTMVPPLARGQFPSYSRAIHENMDGYEQMFMRLRDNVKDTWGKTQEVGGIGDEAAFAKYLDDADGRITEARIMADGVSQAARDFTLLAYPLKKNIDLPMSYVYPYQFWYSRTYVHWIKRMTSDPHVIAGYSRYRSALEKVHAGAPEWWKYNVNSNEMLGLDAKNPLYFNLEATLNPLNGLTGVDFDDPMKRTGWVTNLMQELGKFGPSMWTPYQLATAAALYMRGENEAAERWGSRLFPQTATIRSITALVLKKPLELDPAVHFFSNGLGPYERRRIGRVLAAFVAEQRYDEASVIDAAATQKGDIWDDAVLRAAQERGPGQLSSFLLGTGFRARSESDLQIDAFYGMYNKFWAMEPDMTPDEVRNGLNAMRKHFPFMDTLLLSRKGGIDRDRAFAYNVMSRIPPSQSDDFADLVGIDRRLLNKFHEEKGHMEEWPQADMDTFMAGMLNLSMILDMPPQATRDEWLNAKMAYGSMLDEGKELFGESIWDQADHYYGAFDETQEGTDKANAILESNPNLEAALSWRDEKAIFSPVLAAYYANIQKLEKYYNGKMYDAIEKELGDDIWDKWATYHALGAIDEEAQSQYWDENPELDRYGELKDAWVPLVQKHSITLSKFLPEGKGASVREIEGELGLGAQNVMENFPQVSENAPSLEQWTIALGGPTFNLVMDTLQSAEPMPLSVQKKLDQLGIEMGFGSAGALIGAISQSLPSATGATTGGQPDVSSEELEGLQQRARASNVQKLNEKLEKFLKGNFTDREKAIIEEEAAELGLELVYDEANQTYSLQ